MKQADGDRKTGEKDHTSQLSETEIRDKAKKHKDRRRKSGILCHKQMKEIVRNESGVSKG